jgi:glycosyltransferase involved in cell wall biosynthesis
MCRSLQEQGTEVLIASTNAGLTDDQISIGVQVNYKGVPAIFFPAQLGDSFKYSKPLRVWLDANVKDFDIVHIHAVFNHACVAATRACRNHDVPYVVRPLGTLDPWSMKQKPLRKALYWHFAARRMLQDASMVHYTSPAEQQATEQSLKLNHGRVVPLGIDNGSESTPLDTRRLDHMFPELAKHPYVLVLSRLLPTKGIDVLLDAFLALAKQKEFSDWRLVLAGEGPSDYVTALKREARAQGGADAVLFPGWLEGETKNAVLRQASLLALPSYHESFGLCVIEALAYSVPVLVSPHVPLANEIETAGAGWVAAVVKASLEAALEEALRSDAERAKRGMAGKNLSHRFSWPQVARQLTVAYQQLLTDRAQSQLQAIAHA